MIMTGSLHVATAAFDPFAALYFDVDSTPSLPRRFICEPTERY
jgi:hypothetical protein